MSTQKSSMQYDYIYILELEFVSWNNTGYNFNHPDVIRDVFTSVGTLVATFMHSTDTVNAL